MLELLLHLLKTELFKNDYSALLLYIPLLEGAIKALEFIELIGNKVLPLEGRIIIRYKGLL
jgi:hypothetical protein